MSRWKRGQPATEAKLGHRKLTRVQLAQFRRGKLALYRDTGADRERVTGTPQGEQESGSGNDQEK